MGEAKIRGTFEERKAQAIAEGRGKKQKPLRLYKGNPEQGLKSMPLYMTAYLVAAGRTYSRNGGRR